jgi:hypothetical protein
METLSISCRDTVIETLWSHSGYRSLGVAADTLVHGRKKERKNGQTFNVIQRSIHTIILVDNSPPIGNAKTNRLNLTPEFYNGYRRSAISDLEGSNRGSGYQT